MNDVCIKDCHRCTLQDGLENKALCATLLLPAMLDRINRQLSEVAERGGGRHPLNQVMLGKDTADSPQGQDDDAPEPPEAEE